jgi:hypothetical protein
MMATNTKLQGVRRIHLFSSSFLPLLPCEIAAGGASAGALAYEPASGLGPLAPHGLRSRRGTPALVLPSVLGEGRAFDLR